MRRQCQHDHAFSIHEIGQGQQGSVEEEGNAHQREQNWAESKPNSNFAIVVKRKHFLRRKIKKKHETKQNYKRRMEGEVQLGKVKREKKGGRAGERKNIKG